MLCILLYHIGNGGNTLFVFVFVFVLIRVQVVYVSITLLLPLLFLSVLFPCSMRVIPPLRWFLCVRLPFIIQMDKPYKRVDKENYNFSPVMLLNRTYFMFRMNRWATKRGRERSRWNFAELSSHDQRLKLKMFQLTACTMFWKIYV